MQDGRSTQDEYEAPALEELGSFQELTGYVGLRNRESLLGYPRNIW
ncbi:lasso RiPP family leader peptide-containing protein [Nonomuraea candida]|nr:lasso RiPP family leader peptide-containing protein [Nonomuraea candida]